MIAVGVGKEDRVEADYIFAKHLLAKIGTCVYHQALAVDGQVYGGTEAFIAIVERPADITGAADDGYTLRGSGAEKGNGQAAACC
jgi:hypothetical protein